MDSIETNGNAGMYATEVLSGDECNLAPPIYDFFQRRKIRPSNNINLRNDIIRNPNRLSSQMLEPWENAFLKMLDQNNTTFSIFINNENQSEKARSKVDEQLAEISVIQAFMSQRTSGGKEIGALADEVGCPPYTFSHVGSYTRGSLWNLSDLWWSEGMETLSGTTIVADPDEYERRMAVLYYLGNDDDFGALEDTFLRTFNPSLYTSCRTDIRDQDIPGKLFHGNRFFVQWQIFIDEMALSLGVQQDAPIIQEIMKRLESISKNNDGSR